MNSISTQIALQISRVAYNSMSGQQRTMLVPVATPTSNLKLTGIFTQSLSPESLGPGKNNTIFFSANCEDNVDGQQVHLGNTESIICVCYAFWYGHKGGGNGH